MSGSLTEGWDCLYKGWEGLTQTVYRAAKNWTGLQRAEVTQRFRAGHRLTQHLQMRKLKPAKQNNLLVGGRDKYLTPKQVRIWGDLAWRHFREDRSEK